MEPEYVYMDNLSKKMRVSAEWQELYPYPKVLDPDGWDRSSIVKYNYSWYEEEITYEEYMQRVLVSTCMFRQEDLV